ncbi:MAG TPA: stage III sporulation protein SpoIIIAB [Desulfobacteria bacterium]|nr:stage III sporulation protein SpoIIIAB [Desulfobacteria bacterium]
MIKAIGICMTLAACGTMGITWAGVYEKRTRHLVAIDSALQLLETEIIYGATPLSEAMMHVSKSCDTEISDLFKNTALELGRMEGVTAGEAWNSAVRVFQEQSVLNNSDLQILKRFGASLGVSDREDQAKHLELARSQLKLAAARAEAAAKKNSTVFRYMGFLGGLLLILVLY